jgi:hypothetical protein
MFHGKSNQSEPRRIDFIMLLLRAQADRVVRDLALYCAVVRHSNSPTRRACRRELPDMELLIVNGPEAAPKDLEARVARKSVLVEASGTEVFRLTWSRARRRTLAHCTGSVGFWPGAGSV